MVCEIKKGRRRSSPLADWRGLLLALATLLLLLAALLSLLLALRLPGGGDVAVLVAELLRRRGGVVPARHLDVLAVLRARADLLEGGEGPDDERAAAGSGVLRPRAATLRLDRLATVALPPLLLDLTRVARRLPLDERQRLGGAEHRDTVLPEADVLGALVAQLVLEHLHPRERVRGVLGLSPRLLVDEAGRGHHAGALLEAGLAAPRGTGPHDRRDLRRHGHHGLAHRNPLVKLRTGRISTWFFNISIF